MYRHLKVRLKLETVVSNSEFPVFVGIKQGTITSPIIYNEASLPAQIGLPISCISKGADTLVLCYTDDPLNLCRSIASLQRIFHNLSDRYLEIGLSVNAAKSHVLFFSLHGSYVPDSVSLGDSEVAATTVVTYLGLPIGSSIKNTRKLLLWNAERKPRVTYANVLTSPLNLERKTLSQMYNSVALPHILYLNPFWDIVTESDRRVW